MKSAMWVLALGAMASGGCKKDRGVEEPLAAAPAEARVVEAVPDDVVDGILARFARVSFDTDSSALSAESKALLAENAAVMRTWPQVRVLVEGHADERGTTEYNLALGARRAAAVAQFLQAQGVSAAQVDTVTFGEERPLVTGSAESAWSRNRRVEFVVTSGSDRVAGTY